MAKRRLWDSASRLSVSSISFGLLFVLLLGSISINCASYNSEHRYRDDDSSSNLDSLIGQWAPTGPLARIGLKALPSSAAPVSAPQLLVEQPVVSFYEQQRPSSTLAEDRQRFYNQLESLENNYYDNINNRDSELLRSYSASDSRASGSSNSPQDQYQIEAAAANQQTEFDSDIEAQRKLLDLLSLSSAGQRQLADYADQPSSSSFEFDNPTKHHLLSSSSYQIVDEADQDNVDSATKLNDLAHPAETSTPSLSADGAEKRSGSQQQEEQPAAAKSKANSTLTTTLVDEDENENELVAKAASRASKIDEGDKNNSTAPQSDRQVSYGKVVTASAEDENDKGGLSRISSLLGGLYNIVADHWPAALKSSASADLKQVAQPALNETSRVSEDEEKTTEGPTKLGVSEPEASEAKKIVPESMEDNSDEAEGEEKHDKEPELEEQVKQTIRIKPKKTNEQQQDKSSRNRVSLLRQSTNMLMPLKSSDELIVESDDQPAGNLLGKYIYAPEHHYHLSTASSFASSDQKRLVTAADAYVDSDEDRQMFANHQRQLASGARNIHAGDDVFSAASAFSQLRPAQAFYAAQQLGGADGDLRASDRFSLLPNMSNNKSNDLYFLVMVAAFCAMAMAVVLAAGLFAYRVQQNRKSSSEQDYPTYGVVGPNNMNINANASGGINGKCGGAASFVGGYFTPSSGCSSTVGSNKSGSVKQLADMYSIGADSGISTGGCGGKSVSAGGKRAVLANDQVGVAGQAGPAANQSANGSRFANQNAARMYHYQHQKQQMIISDRSSNGRQTSASDLDSEEENDENSYTVYECPGLASAHEMEIKNPLFNDDQTP